MLHAPALPGRAAGREAQKEPSERRPARGQRRGARGGRRAGALAPDGSRKCQGRQPGGLSGSKCNPGHGLQVRAQPPPRASSASQQLPSPAVCFKSFRGQVGSAASSAGRSPGLRATLGGGRPRRDAAVPASLQTLPQGALHFSQRAFR